MLPNCGIKLLLMEKGLRSKTLSNNVLLSSFSRVQQKQIKEALKKLKSLIDRKSVFIWNLIYIRFTSVQRSDVIL